MEKRLEITVKNHYTRQMYNQAIKETGIALEGNTTILTYDETFEIVKYSCTWLALYSGSVQKFLRSVMEMWRYWTTPNVDYSKEIRFSSKEYIKFID